MERKWANELSASIISFSFLWVLLCTEWVADAVAVHSGQFSQTPRVKFSIYIEFSVFLRSFTSWRLSVPEIQSGTSLEAWNASMTGSEQSRAGLKRQQHWIRFRDDWRSANCRYVPSVLMNVFRLQSPCQIWWVAACIPGDRMTSDDATSRSTTLYHCDKFL